MSLLCSPQNLKKDNATEINVTNEMDYTRWMSEDYRPSQLHWVLVLPSHNHDMSIVCLTGWVITTGIILTTWYISVISRMRQLWRYNSLTSSNWLKWISLYGILQNPTKSWLSRTSVYPRQTNPIFENYRTSVFVRYHSLCLTQSLPSQSSSLVVYLTIGRRILYWKETMSMANG